jgi:formate/nitrite transporter FocA (FNT family)
VIEESEHGAPSAGAVLSDRFGSDEIFERILTAADEEIQTSFRKLFFSALAGGLAITLTFLLYANLYAASGGHPILSGLLYPIGFVYIILGRYQLYTENTLPPVTLVLERLASLPLLLYVWIGVFLGNAIGGSLGALVLAYTGVLSPEAMNAATTIAHKGLQTPFGALFFKAAIAGFIVAGVVWLDYAVREGITRFFLIYMAFLAIPYGNLYHSVVSVTETVYLSLLGEIAFIPGMVYFVFPVLLGNTIGGVLLVTVVNYFQTARRRVRSARGGGTDVQLSLPETLLGPLVGRTYVSPEEDDEE